jgi:hypothetical protein
LNESFTSSNARNESFKTFEPRVPARSHAAEPP